MDHIIFYICIYFFVFIKLIVYTRADTFINIIIIVIVIIIIIIDNGNNNIYI